MYIPTIMCSSENYSTETMYRFLLKTVNFIGQFSLFSPIIALTRVSHKTNTDRSWANFLIYMGTLFTSYPKLCAMLHSYFLSSAFTQLLSICTALWGENLRIFINITYSCDSSVLWRGLLKYISEFLFKKGCYSYTVLKNWLLPLKSYTHHFALGLLKSSKLHLSIHV